MIERRSVKMSFLPWRFPSVTMFFQVVTEGKFSIVHYFFNLAPDVTIIAQGSSYTMEGDGLPLKFFCTNFLKQYSTFSAIFVTEGMSRKEFGKSLFWVLSSNSLLIFVSGEQKTKFLAWWRKNEVPIQIGYWKPAISNLEDSFRDEG